MLKKFLAVVLILVSLDYIAWTIQYLNWGSWWLAVPYLLANLLLLAATWLSIVNQWQHTKLPLLPLPDSFPRVAVIVPTVNESEVLVATTLKSILAQDFPHSNMVIVVSDDGRRKDIARLVQQFQAAYPCAVIRYHAPEPHNDFKAGNLNSATRYVTQRFPDIEFIETRDCDDLVGHPQFLQHTLAYLLKYPGVGWVQTIKEYLTEKGDPFGNQEQSFYRVSMYAKMAANAVFPCGSGLVYRLKTLIDIGGFVTTGAVEDLRTGYKAHRAGWTGAYLPIVGAIGQIAPEDIAVVKKQRSSWALDTQSLMFWQPPLLVKGLSLRQRLQYLELTMFYWYGWGMIVFMVTPIFALLLDIYPVVTTEANYALHFWPFFIAMEAYHVTLNKELSYESLWRSRQIWFSMAPFFVKATLQAILNGPHKRPLYKVTRKERKFSLYWRQTPIQWLVTLALLGSLAYHVRTHNLISQADLRSMFWAVYFVIMLRPATLGSIRGLSIRKEFSKVTTYTQNRASPMINWIVAPRYALLTMIIVILATSIIVGSTMLSTNTLAMTPDQLGSSAAILPVTHLASRAAYPVPAGCEPFGLGVYYSEYWRNGFQPVADLENLLAHDVCYALLFTAMGDGDSPFPSQAVAEATARGYVTMITIEPWRRAFDARQTIQPEYSLESIALGHHDEYFRQWAQDAASSGVPIIVRFAHEQATAVGSRSWYPWQGDPVNYVAAFRHVVGVFNQENARNVSFIWSGMWLDQPNSWLYYPGDDAADIIGTTVLNHGAATEWGWMTFEFLFGAQYDAIVARTDKPIMITELGSAEQGGNKAEWLREMFRLLATRYTRVNSIFILEYDVDRQFNQINWSLHSSPETLQAAREALAEYFNR
ncbi:MAG: glycosyltransferase [bacterium]|nr:glycosyltransferase [bacterium]